MFNRENIIFSNQKNYIILIDIQNRVLYNLNESYILLIVRLVKILLIHAIPLLEIKFVPLHPEMVWCTF